MFLFPSILDLITQVSTILPADVHSALTQKRSEETHVSGAMALDIVQKNIELAKEAKVPMCQDTGFPTFYVEHNGDIDTHFITDQIHTAVRMATRKGTLRPNAVDPLSGQNTGDNCGQGFPKIQFHNTTEREKDTVSITLLLKGGGCENVSGQMALPSQTDFGRANRDLEGVEKAVLQIIKNAEGKGCAPGIVGVHVGGDRSSGYEYAKKNLLRTMKQRSHIPELEVLEESILSKANNLDIGAMGFGGDTTLLDCFCSASHRLPASFFVTVSYSCWALRKGSVVLNMKTGEKIESSQKEEMEETSKKNTELDFTNAKKLTLPLSDEDIQTLNKGDMVLLSGTIYTGRDEIHHAVVEKNMPLPVDISGSAIYHCGPIMKQNDDATWQCLSAGPTTSIREEPYQSDFIEKSGIKAVIGKGNMGEKTLAGLRKNNAVYMHAIGGAAAVYAQCIHKVSDVFFLEKFGMPEAMWQMEVQDFPVMVTMK